MERQRRGWELQSLGDGAGCKPSKPLLDQHPEDGEPGLLSERAQRSYRVFRIHPCQRRLLKVLFHHSNIIELWAAGHGLSTAFLESWKYLLTALLRHGEVRVWAPIVYHILIGDREVTPAYCRSLLAALTPAGG